MLLGERYQLLIPFKLLKVVIDDIVAKSFKYGHSSLNIRDAYPTTDPAMYVFLECRGEKERIFQLFCKLTNSVNCTFAINVLNNEKPCRYLLLLVNTVYGLVDLVSGGTSRDS